MSNNMYEPLLGKAISSIEIGDYTLTIKVTEKYKIVIETGFLIKINSDKEKIIKNIIEYDTKVVILCEKMVIEIFRDESYDDAIMFYIDNYSINL